MTQNLWRDEAFSVLAAQQSIGFIVQKLGFEPPVYYTMLHFWIRMFGESDLVARGLSLLGYMLATWIIIEWADQMYKKHWLSIFLPLFFFLNPMLLYYAFEVRTYAWYTFFSVATLYAYANKKWRLFILAAVFGFYTHVYLLLFLGALSLHWLITTRPHLKRIPYMLKHNKALRSFIVIFLSIMPWLIKIGLEMSRLRHSWYFPVDMRLVYSVLGNMFTGYEGTPWYGWTYTKYLSLVIIALSCIALTDKQNRTRTILFILFGALPLACIVSISFIKPLYVNRYLIPATIAEVLVITSALYAIRHTWLQKITAAALLLCILWFNWWFPPQHPKTPLRATLIQINALVKNSDIFVADNPLIYLETLYYASDRSRVYLYNPNNTPFPWYIGDALITPSRMITDYPIYPTRAFLIHTDASFDIVYRIPLGAQQAQRL